jgi:hypothetical protein
MEITSEMVNTLKEKGLIDPTIDLEMAKIELHNSILQRNG